MSIPIYIPFGDNERVDLIADFNGKLNKIQVKTSLKAENGKMVFDLSTSTFHRKNGFRYTYTKADVDYFALYNIKRDVILLIKQEDVPKTSIVIRYDGLNFIKSHHEKEYIIDNVLNKFVRPLSPEQYSKTLGVSQW